MLFVIPLAFLLQPKPVEAIPVNVTGNTSPTELLNTKTNTLSWLEQLTTAISTAGTWLSTKLIEVKEYILDGLAFAVINALIAVLAQDIISWINSGFKGNPAFITDPAQFFLDVGDQATGEFLSGSDFALLCAPFVIQVKIALSSYRTRSGRYRCTASRIIQNSRNFLNNVSSVDTWNSWLQISGNPVNNPYGAFMIANDEISVRIANKSLIQGKMLDWAKGFFSVSDPACVARSGRDESAPSPTPSGNNGRDEDTPTTNPIVVGADCPKVTPGAAIQNQLNSALDLPKDRLVVAKAFNEILGALLIALAKKALTGAGGLLGLSKGSYSGGSSYSSYLSQLGNQAIPDSTSQSIGGSALTDIGVMLTFETEITQTKGAMYSQLLGAQNNLGNLAECYQSKSASSTISGSEQALLVETNSTLANITSRAANTLRDKNDSEKLANEFAPIKEIFQSEPSSSTLYKNALFKYQTLRLNSTFRTSVDVKNVRKERDDLQEELAALNAITNERLQQCNLPPEVLLNNQINNSNNGGGSEGGN